MDRGSADFTFSNQHRLFFRRGLRGRLSTVSGLFLL